MNDANRELGRLADELNEQLSRAETWLATHYPLRQVNLDIGGRSSRARLLYTGQRLLVQYTASGEEQPVRSASIATRLEVARMLPKVFQIVKLDPYEIKQAANELSDFLDEFEVRSKTKE